MTQPETMRMKRARSKAPLVSEKAAMRRPNPHKPPRRQPFASPPCFSMGVGKPQFPQTCAAGATA